MLVLVIKSDKGRQVVNSYDSCNYVSNFSSIDDMCEFFTNLKGSEEFKIGDECELYFNNELIMTGYVKGIRVNSSRNISIGCVSKCDILKRSYIPDTVNTSYTQNRSIVSIIRPLCESVGVELDYDGSIASLTAVDYSVLEKDKSIYENIKTLLDPYNIFMRCTSDGKLYLYQLKTDTVDYTLQGKDIINSTVSFDDKFRGQEYNTISQKPCRLLKSNKSSVVSNTASLTGTSPLSIVKRKWIESSNISTTNNNSISANIAEGSTISANVVTTQNIFMNTGLVIKASFDYAKFITPQKWLIQSMLISTSSNSMNISYTLCDPAKYSNTYDVSKFIRSDWVKY